MGRDRSQKPMASRKPSEKGHGPCVCGEDHYRRDCPHKNKDSWEEGDTKRPQEKENRKKSFNSLPHEQELEEPSSALDEDSESDEDREHRQSSHFTIIKQTLLSFSHSTNAPPRRIIIKELPRAPSVGAGLSWLNGDPLPVEIWLDAQENRERKSVTGCADSGGQCLIKHSVLMRELSDSVLSLHPSIQPEFAGIGGVSERALGFVTIPVFFSDRRALKGKEDGHIAKVWLEFHVVASLDCNFLIGHDAMRAYGMDVMESGDYILIGTMKVPIADHSETVAKCQISRQVNNSVMVAKETIVKAHSTVVIPISISTSLPEGKDLLFSPRNVMDQASELMGVMSCHLVRFSTPVIQFDNICDYPIRIEKGQILGSVAILGPRTKMTYFSSPSVTIAEASLFLFVGATSLPDVPPHSHQEKN